MRDVEAPKVSRQVRRGVAYLDRVEPGWYERVIPARIDLLDAQDCILGQVFGDFNSVNNDFNRIHWMVWVGRNGFVHQWPTRSSLEKRENEWRDYVAYRRGLVSVTREREYALSS